SWALVCASPSIGFGAPRQRRVVGTPSGTFLIACPARFRQRIRPLEQLHRNLRRKPGVVETGEEGGAVHRRRSPLGVSSFVCSSGTRVVCSDTPTRVGANGSHSTGTFPPGEAQGCWRETTPAYNSHHQHLRSVHTRQCFSPAGPRS